MCCWSPWGRRHCARPVQNQHRNFRFKLFAQEMLQSTEHKHGFLGAEAAVSSHAAPMSALGFTTKGESSEVGNTACCITPKYCLLTPVAWKLEEEPNAKAPASRTEGEDGMRSQCSGFGCEVGLGDAETQVFAEGVRVPADFWVIVAATCALCAHCARRPRLGPVHCKYCRYACRPCGVPVGGSRD